ncbi:hypothetical protein CSDK_0822 [Streptococcus dysgalactiae]
MAAIGEVPRVESFESATASAMILIPIKKRNAFMVLLYTFLVKVLAYFPWKCHGAVQTIFEERTRSKNSLETIGFKGVNAIFSHYETLS